jgi:hypothetical protein
MGPTKRRVVRQQIRCPKCLKVIQAMLRTTEAGLKLASCECPYCFSTITLPLLGEVLSVVRVDQTAGD